MCSTRQKSRASPVCSRAVSRRPRLRPTPPTSLSSQPRTAHASGNEYQPFSPPMPSITDQRSSMPADVSRFFSSMNTVWPAQSGSLGSASAGASSRLAPCQEVSTSPARIFASASRTARR